MANLARALLNVVRNKGALADGYQVTVFDRDAKHAAPLIVAGAAGATGLLD